MGVIPIYVDVNISKDLSPVFKNAPMMVKTI